jgi:hypothetical protein
MISIRGGLKMINEKTDEKIKKNDEQIKNALIISLILSGGIAAFAWHAGQEAITIAAVGVVSFLIPMILAYSYDYNLATLDNGAIRKSITISLTIVYIILLSMFFVNSMSSGMGSDNASVTVNHAIKTQTDNAGMDQTNNAGKDQADNAGKDQADNAGKDQADNAGKDQADNAGKDQADNAEKDQADNAGNDEKAPTKDIITNFLYIYAIIIGFYFGSRTAENYWNTNITKEILKNASGMQILEKRYAMGEINEIFVENMKKNMMSIQAERILLEAGESESIMKEAAKELQEEINRLKALGQDTGKLEELMKKWRGE